MNLMFLLLLPPVTNYQTPNGSQSFLLLFQIEKRRDSLSSSLFELWQHQKTLTDIFLVIGGSWVSIGSWCNKRSISYNKWRHNTNSVCEFLKSSQKNSKTRTSWIIFFKNHLGFNLQTVLFSAHSLSPLYIFSPKVWFLPFSIWKPCFSPSHLL